ncbi:MAG: hypothetical protein U1E82_02680 [Nitrosomonas sp.]|nr:hypothetical protein [Nitrosomonas sp.]
MNHNRSKLVSYRRLGYRFLLRRYLPQWVRINILQQPISTRYEMHPALVYEPPGDSIHTIIAFPGLSVHGYRDHRMDAVARAFSYLGFRVIIPCVSDIEQLIIHPSTISKFAALIEAIATHSELNPNHRQLGIFSASYSGGVALLAASHPQISSFIKAMCLIGTFADFRNVIRFVLDQEEIDEYARFILLRNLLSQSSYRNPEVIQLFDIAVADNGFKKKKPLLPYSLQNTSKEATHFFCQLLEDTFFRRQVTQSALEEIDRREHWLNRFDLDQQLTHIDFSISLIHGYHDQVIPSHESIFLHKRLAQLGKKSHLILTSLLDHGDFVLNKNFFVETDKLAQGLGFFVHELCENTS